ncbi:polar amino acid transport system substrate-binding protein [Gibbsiella quercinecans]|uniref:Amino acid ABC transporter substrate-binding protein n=2 Tax=Gibbsiella TaxID=929812 RepID=A0A250B046_9GAMM|nr:transporter substrate-binding domain-containing protein [Gibbsiella quercinecans]ATA19610.1 amino acid ABC transporter substrate-binding protein [Gibbsiella quercinecans]RLM04268.1 amino acid ABC transporter substrate-binding protein [Gibbsiella quercinecans]RLM06470.1 amino acid ABC transporter substrate-binding protein [Gibbsiella quercinecans]TCT83262.1 polar amino acid transport system substrate-binding protein [Gibbsiella quercinecans]
MKLPVTARRSLRCTALLSLLLGSLSAQPALAAEAVPTLTSGVLKVGIEVAYPPFESWQGDKVVGFDAELAALLSKHLGTRLALADTQFSGLILGLNAARHDAVISALYVTAERTAQADAIPYADTGAYILVRSDSAVKPKDEKALCGLTVGLQQGTAWVKQLQDLSSDYCLANGKAAIAVKEYPTAPETLQALLAGHIQAQVDMAGAARMFVERSRGRAAISSPAIIYPQTLGIYVKKGNQALLGGLKTALQTIRDNGEYAALLAKYQPYGITDTAAR